MRPAPAFVMTFDTRTSSSDCADKRRDPRRSSRMRCEPCGSVSCVVAAPGFAAEALQTGGDDDARPRHVDDPHHPEDVRAIVRQSAVGICQVVRVPS
jgi:hypothetical protein